MSIGKIEPTPGLVDQYFNDSTGEGENGENDARGPWNQGNGWQYVDSPAFNGGLKGRSRGATSSRHSEKS